MPGKSDKAAVEGWLRDLQQRLCGALQALEPRRSFATDTWGRDEGGGGDTRVLSDGLVFEKAGVAFSCVSGQRLPAAASAQRPQLAGRSWTAMGVSLVLHPVNPYVPTSHLNVRFLTADAAGKAPIWWFGGGFDLTPYYAFDEDCRHWHTVAAEICTPFGESVYPRLKRWCDEYFFLHHRDEARGVGGLFFDDWTEGGFDCAYALTRSVGEHFLPAYLPIVKRRRRTLYGRRERAWQLYRRGRYVEFNLVWDRGTLFGLQSGGRTESILMSMPPLVSWRYGDPPEAGPAEAGLREYLRPRNWLDRG